jgi:hypothetical protein
MLHCEWHREAMPSSYTEYTLSGGARALTIRLIVLIGALRDDIRIPHRTEH